MTYAPVSPGDRLRVVDASPVEGRSALRRPPFRVGQVLTCKSHHGAGPDGLVEVEEHPLKRWRLARFEPVEG